MDHHFELYHKYSANKLESDEILKLLSLTSFSASRSPFRKSTFLVYSVSASAVGLLKKTQVDIEQHKLITQPGRKPQ